MADSSPARGSDSSRRQGLPRIAWIALIALAVLIVAYFGLTSGAFLKAVVLPRVGAAMHATVTAADLSWSPFSRIELRQLKVETAGSPPLFQAERVVVRYGLFSLIRGNLNFPEILLESPSLTVVQRADGSSNLDPLLAPDPKAQGTVPRSAPLVLDLGTVSLTKGAIHYARAGADGSNQTSDITELELRLDHLAEGTTNKLTLAAAIHQATTPASGGTNAFGRLPARLTGTFDFTLNKKLQPEFIAGSTRLEVAQADGTFKDLTGLVGVLTCDLIPTEVRQVSVRFERGGKRLGTMSLQGPFDVKKGEARVKLKVESIDRNVLNLVGAPFGLDFADTTVDLSASVDVSRGGQTLAMDTGGTVAKLSVRQGARVSPPVDLTVTNRLTVNLEEKSAVVQSLAVKGQQAGREVCSATLDRSMYLSWGARPEGVTEAGLKVELKDLRLSDWGMFLGTNAPAGTIQATALLTSQMDGRKVSATMSVAAADLAWALGSYQVRKGAAQLELTGTFSDYRSVLVDKYSLRLAEQDTPLFAVSGSAGYDVANGGLNLQLVLESELPKCLARFPVPKLTASSGRITVDGLMARDQGLLKATLNLGLANFTGAYADYQFKDHEIRLGLDADSSDKTLNLRRVQITARQGTGPAGGVDVSGKYDRIIETGDFLLNIDGLAESGLKPFLDPFLSPRQLVSARLNGSGSGRYAAQGGASIKLQTELKNVRIDDPTGLVPNTPMTLQFGVEAAYRSNVIDLVSLGLALPPTPRAGNALDMEGRISLVPTNAITGQVKIHSEAIELSELLDSFMTNRPAATLSAAPVPAPVEPQEPPAMNLPIQQFRADLQIDRLFVKEIVITNWIATATLSQNTLVLDPFKLTMNGGAIAGKAKVDLRQPGFTYEGSLDADKIPIAPLSDTFAPARRGQLGGDLHAKFQMTGAGMTAPNLQRKLTAQFDAGTTNINLALGNVKSSLLKSIVNAVVGIPDLVRNPSAMLGNVLGQLAGNSRDAAGGWVDELAKSPIQTIALRGKAANGQVELEQATVQSPAFLSEARGTIALMPVLTNSTLQIPVLVSLRRALAEKIGVLPAGTPADSTYTKLPEFLSLEGTLGDPKTKINKVALLALTAKAGGGLIGNTGNPSLDKASGVLNAVGSLLGGSGGAAPTTARTNAPATNTNQPANKPLLPANPLDLFKKK